MLGAEHASLTAGRHALAWVLGQTDVWYLLYRCAHYVSKGRNPSQSSVSILDNLFTLEEDQHDTPEFLDYNHVPYGGEGKETKGERYKLYGLQRPCKSAHFF